MRVLRQGDPLSHFLFILAMEGLHMLIKEAMDSYLSHGVCVRWEYFIISHLLYVDDVEFVLEMVRTKD